MLEAVTKERLLKTAGWGKKVYWMVWWFLVWRLAVVP
jgi:hypothetical protein